MSKQMGNCDLNQALSLPPPHYSSSSSRAAKILYNHRLAQDGRNCRFSIADCRWTLEGVATPLFQSSIGNQQSAMKTWSLVATNRVRVEENFAGEAGQDDSAPRDRVAAHCHDEPFPDAVIDRDAQA
ncbi:MAG: hypothetical protein ABSH01_28005 [Terriglobia bacterium]|jgi:hypothetical protein